MRMLIGSIAAVLLAGCAAQPSGTTPANASAAPVAAAVAPAVPAAAPAAASPASDAAAGTAASSVKSYPGYKMKQKDGVTVYCKKVAKIGSRFEEETCMTPAEMEQMAQKAEEDRQQFRRNQTLCGTGGCGGG
jgi:hypothetical protein